MTKKQEKIARITKELQELCDDCIIIAGSDSGCAFALKGTKLDLLAMLATTMEEDDKLKGLLKEAIELHNAGVAIMTAVRERNLEEPTIKGKN